MGCGSSRGAGEHPLPSKALEDWDEKEVDAWFAKLDPKCQPHRGQLLPTAGCVVARWDEQYLLDRGIPRVDAVHLLAYRDRAARATVTTTPRDSSRVQVGANAPPLDGVGEAADAATADEAPADGGDAAAGADVFSRLAAALQRSGTTPGDAFAACAGGSGELSVEELTQLLHSHLPDASDMDIKHYQAVIETQREDCKLSREEFATGVPRWIAIHTAVREGRDQDSVVPRLQSYLKSHDDFFRQAFQLNDSNGDGALNHKELQQLAQGVRGLDVGEKQFILAVLYEHDAGRNQDLTLSDLHTVLRQFSKSDPEEAPAASDARDAAAGSEAGEAGDAAASAAGHSESGGYGAGDGDHPLAPPSQASEPAALPPLTQRRGLLAPLPGR